MFCKPIFSLVFLMSGCVGVSACLAWQGKVTHVSDGDTLWVQAALHRQPVKVRILGIDAPEICQAWGAQSRQALQAAILGRAVNVQGAHKDSFGRLLAKLRVHGDDVGGLDGAPWTCVVLHLQVTTRSLRHRANAGTECACGIVCRPERSAAAFF